MALALCPRDRSNARRAASLAFALAALLLSIRAGAEQPASDSGEALAEQPAPDSGNARAEPSPAQGLSPPEPVGSIAIAYPAGAPPRAGAFGVRVNLTIGIDGAVTSVELVEGAGEPFDRAVLEGAYRFVFRPALLDGKPVEVVVPFTQTFVPPVDQASAGPEADGPRALLEGIVVQRGTRKAVGGATVVVQDARGERLATTDAEGRFSVKVAPGEVRVQVSAQGLRRFARGENLRRDEHLKVKYLVDRESYDPYESVVVGARERTEISRTTLSGREIHQLPGTFGDPFRVVSALPGVSQAMSLLPMPIVRGSSPGDTGAFLDGIRLPLLFHLFAGPSVVHPEFVERVDFYPGGFPVTFGGYLGGIIDGRTARPRAGSDRLDLDLNLLQTGVFVRRAIPKTSMTATVAGRYGYPGLVLSALNSELSLDYWDYQARLDGGSPNDAWTVFLFGARDQVRTREDAAGGSTEMKTQALFLFHRLDLRYRRGGEDRNGSYRAVVGYDASELAGDQLVTRSWFVDPQASWTLPLHRTLRLRVGSELLLRDIRSPDASPNVSPMDQVASTFVQPPGLFVTSGGYLELPWKPVERLLVAPGVRADLYSQRGTRQWSVDPRLSVRWKPLEVRELWLKGVVGRYHQPPRLSMPAPGFDQASLELGLLASTQTGLGFEAGLAPGVELDVQGYYNHMNPVVIGMKMNPDLSDLQEEAPSSPWGAAPGGAPSDFQEGMQQIMAKRLGRSYGLEVLLRKRDTQGVYGWLAYTLSHSERMGDSGWAPYDFDRAHLVNAVAGVRLPRNWELGARLSAQSGTPMTTIYGYNAGRGDWQFRADLRVDKRAVWNDWLLDFYVDVVNASVAPESGGLLGGRPIRYVLPTVGFRAVM